MKELEVYGDSALIISQVQNKWQIKEEMLMPYHQCLQKWSSKFSKIQYQYVPRMQNQIEDALATMESMMDGLKEDEARLICWISKCVQRKKLMNLLHSQLITCTM